MSNADFLEKDQTRSSAKTSSNDINLKREKLPNWAINYAASKYNLDVEKVNLNLISSSNSDIKGMAIGNNIFIEEKYKNDDILLKHEIAHIYQQAMGMVSNSDAEDLETQAINDSLDTPLSGSMKSLESSPSIGFGNDIENNSLAKAQKGHLIQPDSSSTSVQFFDFASALTLIGSAVTFAISIFKFFKSDNSNKKSHKEQIAYDMQKITYDYTWDERKLNDNYGRKFKCFCAESINKLNKNNIDVLVAEHEIETIFFLIAPLFNKEKMYEPYVDDYIKLKKLNKTAPEIRQDLKKIGYYSHLAKERKRIMDIYIYMNANIEGFDVDINSQNMYNLFDIESRKPKNILNKKNAELYVAFYKGTNNFNNININDIKKSTNIFKVLDTREEPENSFEKKNSQRMVQSYTDLSRNNKTKLYRKSTKRLNNIPHTNDTEPHKLALLFSDATNGFKLKNLNNILQMFQTIYGNDIGQANSSQMYSFISILQYCKDNRTLNITDGTNEKELLSFCQDEPDNLLALMDMTDNFHKRPFNEVKDDIKDLFAQDKFHNDLITDYKESLFSSNFFEHLERNTIHASIEACSHILPSFNRLLTLTDNFQKHTLDEVKNDMRGLALGDSPYHEEIYIKAYESLALLTNFFRVRSARNVNRDFRNLYTDYYASSQNILNIYKDYEHIFIEKAKGFQNMQERDYNEIINENKKTMNAAKAQ